MALLSNEEVSPQEIHCQQEAIADIPFFNPSLSIINKTNFELPVPVLKKNNTFLSQKNAQQITQSIEEWFSSWEPWQIRILLAGIIHRFTKSQLKGLNTAVESVFHCDFQSNWRNIYEMKKTKHTTNGGTSTQDKINKDGNNIASELSEILHKNSQFNQHPENENCFKNEETNVATKENRQGSSCVSFEQVTGYHLSKEKHDFLSKRNSKKLSVLSQIPFKKTTDAILRLDSSASSSSEFQSRVTALNVKPDEFFPQGLHTEVLGKFVTSKSKAGSYFLSKLDIRRNHAPFPTSKQLYKKEKFWSDQHVIVFPQSKKLKEQFRVQLNQIWEWISWWKEHQKVKLLLHLLSLSNLSAVKFVADCIKHSVAEELPFNNFANLLPETYWLEVFKKLDLDDIMNVGQVCKRWHYLTQSDALWKNKCLQFGKEFKITNLITLIKENAQDNETLDWKQAYLELNQLGFEANKLSSTIEDKPNDQLEAESYTSSDDEEEIDYEKYKHYIPYWKLRLADPQYEEETKSPISLMHSLNSEKNLHTTKKQQSTSRISFRQPENDLQELQNLTKQPQTLSKEQQRDLISSPIGDEGQRVETIIKPSHSPQSGVIPKEIPPVKPQASRGFLQLWENITKELKDTDVRSESQRSDKCYDVEMFNTLLSDKEVENAAEDGMLFAVDHKVKLPQAAVGKYWLVDNNVVPVAKVSSLEGHRGSICCVLCQGRRIFSGGFDRRIRLWTSRGESFAKMEDSSKGSIAAMAIGGDEQCRTLYTASWDETVSVWDSLTYKCDKILFGHKDTVSGLAVDANYIVSCSHDGTIRVWNISTFKCERVIEHHKGAIYCLSYADKLIISGGADKLIFITDAGTGTLRQTLRGHKSPVNAIKRQHNLIVSGDVAGHLMFWPLDGDGSPFESIKAHEKQINDIAFHGGRFFTVSNDRLVKEWELLTMTCVRILQGHTREVNGVQYTNRYLATCSADGTLRLWFWGGDESA